MTVLIGKKPYFTVKERIEMLNKDTKGEYSLISEVLEINNDKVLVKATLTYRGQTYTGHSEESRKSSTVNQKVALENAETSARGRALMAAGYHGEPDAAHAAKLAKAHEQAESRAKEEKIKDLVTRLEAKARKGTEEFADEWDFLDPADRTLVTPRLGVFRKMATQADATLGMENNRRGKGEI